jgi:hypothetical protein
MVTCSGRWLPEHAARAHTKLLDILRRVLKLDRVRAVVFCRRFARIFWFDHPRPSSAIMASAHHRL